MRVLLIGDIVGLPGCRAVAELLPGIVSDYRIDVTIANAENAAGGFGLTQTVALELFACGIQVLTSGNHIWDKRAIVKFIDRERRLLRPANFPPETPGRGSVIISDGAGQPFGVVNLSGRVFMDSLDCPFRAARREIDLLREETPVIIVDMHAEATSEKIAMGWFLDGSVSAVLGTHTHVQTADEKILPQGTAYITDVGMTGSADSVIGIMKQQALQRFLTQMPVHFAPAENDARLQGALVDIDPATGKSTRIERITRSCAQNNYQQQVVRNDSAGI
jgi:metallophosphoesterase (TIGR00282 family)